ncbi:MAG: hypothetical protein WC295_03025 [Methanoregula sp.]|jgi:hypothetical protein
MNKPDRIGIVLFILLLASVAGSGCVDNPVSVNQTTRNNMSSAAHIPPDYSPFPSIPDPNTVPVATAYNQTLSTFWSFTIDGPYSTQPNWTGATLDPEPVVLYDINGKPQYYEFYLRNRGTVPGYFWTAANKLMGHVVFRIYEGAPAYNHTRIAQDAARIISARYPAYPILSITPALYSGGYPHLCARVMVRNTTSGKDERIIIDAFTQECVPDHPSPDYTGHEYAWSYLDSIPTAEYPARVAQWELHASNTTGIVAYAMTQGIDTRLPLSEKNASIIRNFSATTSPDSSVPTPDPTPDVPDIRPVTDELIGQNEIPVEIAREHARVVLWRIVIDRPDSFASRSWRNASLDGNDPAIIEDFTGRKLYYVFSVHRNGIPVSGIIVDANKGLYSHPWGLATPAGEYALVNATRKARERAAQEFPRDTERSLRPVYSLTNNCCHNVTVMLEVENPQTHAVHRILVDTYTMTSAVETVDFGNGNGVGSYQSLFSVVTPEDFADNLGRWETANAGVKNVTAFAAAAGIHPDMPLRDSELQDLGTHLFLADTRHFALLFDLVHPAPGPRATLTKQVQVWHEQADWFSGIYVDGVMSDAEIARLVHDYLPSGYRLDIFPIQWSSGNYGYYLNVTDADYARTFSLLKEDRSVFNRELEYNMDFVQVVKRENGIIRIPLGVLSPMEANVLRLAEKGVNLTPMKMVYIQYDTPTQPAKVQREKVLSELNTDDRVLFAFKEYAG